MKQLNYLITLIIILTGCSGSNNQSNSIDIYNLTTTIDSIFHQSIETNGPGACVLVVYDGKILHAKGYGLADIENCIPNKPRTNMRIASVSKQFTAMAILTLIDQKLLSLDDSINAFFNAPVFRNITIEHLLTHTSGLPDNEVVFMKNWDRSKIAENKDVLEWYIKENPSLKFEPGKSWDYSNSGYNLLAIIVERISGQSFQDYINEKIFKSIGVKTATYFDLAHPIDVPERAFAYGMDETNNYKKEDGHFLNGLLGADGLFMNLLDYYQWDQALRNEKIISKKLHREALMPQVEISPEFNKLFGKVFSKIGLSPSSYGYGWFVTKKNKNNLVWHQGGWYGTQSMVIRELERPLTIALFGNTDELSLELMTQLYNLCNLYIFKDSVQPLTKNKRH